MKTISGSVSANLIPSRLLCARIVLAAILVLAVGVCVTPQTLAAGPDLPPTAALTQLVERFSKAQQAFDVATLRDLTAEDYVEVSPLGEVDPRDKMLGFYAPEHKVDPPEMSIQDNQVRVFGDIGVVLARISYTMKGLDSQPHTHDLRATFVARKTSEGWKLVSTSFTPLRTPPTK